MILPVHLAFKVLLLLIQLSDEVENEVLDEETTLEIGRKLMNHTKYTVFSNPIDVATVIDILENLVLTQADAFVLNVETRTDGKQVYMKTKETYPTTEDTITFTEVSHLLSLSKDEGAIYAYNYTYQEKIKSKKRNEKETYIRL